MNSIQIPYTIDNIKVGEIYEIKVINIFDPSKLWIIVHFRELHLFTKHLNMYYGDDEIRIKIPKFKIKKDLLCIVQKNQMFYRAIVLPLLVRDENKIRVFLLDTGSFINVDVNNIFYISQKHCLVPRFSLRACIINIAPNLKHSLIWTIEENQFLTELIADKKIYAKIEGINKFNKILYIDILRKDNCEFISLAKSISLKFLKSGLASLATMEPQKPGKITKYMPTVEYPYLFPTIESIEEGTVPSSLWELSIVKGNVPLDLLLGLYYVYQDINAQV